MKYIKLNMGNAHKINAVIILLCCLTIQSLLAQTNTAKIEINGKITTSDGDPVVYATVLLENTNVATSSNENGLFSFYAPEGKYLIKVSSIGYQTIKKEFVVSPTNSSTVNFTLSESSNQLQEVEILGRKAKTYKNNETFAATKTATKIKDIPQAVSYVTKEVIADQQAYRVNDIIKNVSGVNQYSWYDDFSFRGFRSGQTYINGLRVIGLFGPQPLLANIERVEVLKGPASAMFGNSSPGGTMNRVTKKPLTEDRKSINFTTGSFNTLRATLDFTGPMNKSKSLLYRLNIGYENSDSFRDLQENKTILIAPSISFLPTDKTSINFDLVIQKFDGKLDRGQPIFGASAGTKLDAPNNTPINFAIGATNDYHKSDVNYFTLSLNHKFSDKISFNSSYMKFSNEEDLFEHRTSNRFALDANGDEMPALMGMRISARQQKKVTDNISNYFVFNVATGQLKHKLLSGFDYAQEARPVGGARIWTGSTDYLKLDGTTGSFDPTNITNFQLDGNGNPIPNIPHFDLVNPNYTLAYPNDYILRSAGYNATKYYTTGYYLQDQITINKLQVLLGLRFNNYYDVDGYKTSTEEKTKQTKFIPRIGMVYSITNNLNAYGTYTESFEPQNASNLAPDVGGPFDPLEGQMVEFGLKGEFFNNKLAANLAIYSILQKNELIDDPNDSERLIQIGETTSKGIELDIMGRINKNFSVTANYAFNEAVFVSIPADSNFQEGDTRQNAPKHQGGIFGKYKITNGALNGISFNLGTNFVSERNSTDGPELKFPSYTVADFGASYEVDKFVLRATVNNVFDKTHWIGGYNYVRLFPGAPRNYLLSVGYTF
jgi:iron complex outermembrane receptor protein